jgi:hypothetical protein
MPGGPPRHIVVPKRYIWIVQYLDKMTWRDANKEYHTEERAAYVQQEALRFSSPEIRFRNRKFEEKD